MIAGAAADKNTTRIVTNASESQLVLQCCSLFGLSFSYLNTGYKIVLMVHELTDHGVHFVRVVGDVRCTRTPPLA
jgi:hypothetical protein